MQRKYYVIFGALSALITFLTIVVSIQGTAGTENSLFHSPWIVFVFVAFVAVQVLGIFTYKGKLNLRGIGFYLTHIGIVIYFVGCFIYYISGQKIPVTLIVDKTAMYNQIRTYSETGSDDYVKLPFDIGVSKFIVEKYEDGSDKYYEATLMVGPSGSRDIYYEALSVNHPYRIDGWKIYLMGYDGTSGSTISLLMKYDPGEYLSLTGLTMMISGCILLCLFRKKEGGKKLAG